MIALHESLVEWTALTLALAMGMAVCAALLRRLPQRGRAVICTPPQPRVRKPSRWTGYWLPCVAMAVIVANAGIAFNAAAAATGSDAAGTAAVGIGAIASLACLVVLLVVWLYLSHSVLPASPPEDDIDCCADCPQCVDAGLAPAADMPGRKRARGLTMTRLGGG